MNQQHFDLKKEKKYEDGIEKFESKKSITANNNFITMLHYFKPLASIKLAISI
jgi:hypothetical protein